MAETIILGIIAICATILGLGTLGFVFMILIDIAKDPEIHWIGKIMMITAIFMVVVIVVGGPIVALTD